MRPGRIAAVALTALVGIALAGCAAAAPAATAAPASLTVSDAWAKAAGASEMTAAFGVLHNDTDADIRVTAASTPASTSTQLHQTTANAAGEMVMSEVKDGFVVPAHGTFPLEPGGNHIMLMGLTSALVAGDEVTITLTLDGGEPVEVRAPVKDYAGGNEQYEGTGEPSHGSGH
ncbi:copper chaperone PCu(A)C [Microbacterium gorillae]|uniref:copper chaperone PCu(A)C n=1 Tax=Microbacterium gorillae TaxID=1231063 RepID=UPI00069376AC|nr:copper chaperone PCu(A)C [Microbacterium gorillae]